MLGFNVKVELAQKELLLLKVLHWIGLLFYMFFILYTHFLF